MIMKIIINNDDNEMIMISNDINDINNINNDD